MIRIGLTDDQKRTEIMEAARRSGAEKIIVFSPKKFWIDPPKMDIPFRQVEWADIIMYKVFYPLLEEIRDKHLLVINECLRTQNRSDLTYNCLKHYLNQTPNRIVFQYFPFIEEDSDFMILADLDSAGGTKGRGLEPSILTGRDVLAVPYDIRLKEIPVQLPFGVMEAYDRKRDALFEALGKRDPDTVPRELHVWCGGYKKAFIDPGKRYVSRNRRFSLPNVTTYKDARMDNYTVIDFPHRRIDFNDFLWTTGMGCVPFLTTGLKVDDYYAGALRAWAERLNGFYAKAGVYAGGCGDVGTAPDRVDI